MAKSASTKKSVRVPRKLKTGRYKSFHLQKPLRSSAPKLIGVFALTKSAIASLKLNWKTFAGILLIYALLSLVLVQGLGNGNINTIKSNLNSLTNGQWGGALSGLLTFVYLASSFGNTGSSVGGVYQLVLVVVISLAIIWTLRQTYATKKVRVRDGFYRGMYPLVPFVMVLFVVVLELLPALVGGYLYNLVTNNGIIASSAEVLLWAVLFFLLVLASLYMLSSSLFALYIVCLPDMTPLTALRSARELVRNRRWMVMRKVIFLPVFLLIAGAIVVTPFIWLLPVVTALVFLIASVASLLVIHGYMYRLYRELL